MEFRGWRPCCRISGARRRLGGAAAVALGVPSLSAGGKTELAEEVLAQFYRAWDVLTWARTPAVGEEAGPERTSNISWNQTLSAPIERLTEESELFSQLHARPCPR